MRNPDNIDKVAFAFQLSKEEGKSELKGAVTTEAQSGVVERMNLQLTSANRLLILYLLVVQLLLMIIN